jgi:hypothetical protein
MLAKHIRTHRGSCIAQSRNLLFLRKQQQKAVSCSTCQDNTDPTISDVHLEHASKRTQATKGSLNFVFRPGQ